MNSSAVVVIARLLAALLCPIGGPEAEFNTLGRHDSQNNFVKGGPCLGRALHFPLLSRNSDQYLNLETSRDHKQTKNTAHLLLFRYQSCLLNLWKPSKKFNKCYTLVLPPLLAIDLPSAF